MILSKFNDGKLTKAKASIELATPFIVTRCSLGILFRAFWGIFWNEWRPRLKMRMLKFDRGCKAGNTVDTRSPLKSR